METIMMIIGILICIMFSLVIVLYMVFAYQIYKVKNKSEVFFTKKMRETIIKDKNKIK
jgi:hypothetical protein